MELKIKTFVYGEMIMTQKSSPLIITIVKQPLCELQFTVLIFPVGKINLSSCLIKGVIVLHRAQRGLLTAGSLSLTLSDFICSSLCTTYACQHSSKDAPVA
jgi:hypothetical protein